MRVLLSSCLLFSLVTAAPAWADDSDLHTESRPWDAGLLLGINMSNAFGSACTFDCDLDLSAVGVEDFDSQGTVRMSDHLALGAFFSYRVRPRYAVRVEARWSTKGAKVQHTAPAVVFDTVEGMDVADFVGLQYTLEHTLHYLQVPVLVQMDIPYDNRFRPHLLAGIGVGYLIASSSEGAGDIVDFESFNRIGSVTGSGQRGDETRRLDLSVILGADMVFPLPRGAFELGFRYELSVLSSLDGGFSHDLDSSRPVYQPIASAPDPSVELDSAPFIADGMRNSILSVVAGYRF